MQLTIYDFQKQISVLPCGDQKKILDRARVIVRDEIKDRCEFCGQITMMSWRAGRKYCNNACKQKSYRLRKGRQTMTEPIIHETKKALTQYQAVKELLSLMDDLEKALQKNDHFEVGRVMANMRDKLIFLFRGLGGKV